MREDAQVNTPVIPSGSVRQEDIIIRTRGLTKDFNGELAVHDVTLYVPRGTIFGFIGPSGSGKTTTIRMLTGVIRPTDGEVEVFGTPPFSFSQSMRARVGYMPQLFVLYPNLSVWENLNFVASIYGMPFRRGRQLREVLDFVELNEHRHKLARDISGGMQRRLSLASTLVHDPDLIFLDEPTAGVDPVLRSKFWEQFREMRDSGRTLFVTTQYVGEAAYCDLVGVMGEGKLLEVDTPTGLRHKAFGGDIVELRTNTRLDYQLQAKLRELPYVVGPITRTGDNSARLIVKEARSAVPDLMDWTQQNNIEVETIEEHQPPFDDVFVKLVQKDRSNE
jgi:ABC-2 type transport system ATP-binding protein